MNINDYIRQASASLADKMAMAGRIPAPCAQSEYEFNADNNTFTLSIVTIPRSECPHTTQAAVQIVDDGVLKTVTACTTCQAIL